jgi:type I restriction enzyme M protein
MMVNLVNPQIDDKILDPACGTAGFLVNAYKYILESNKRNGVSTLTPKDKKKLDEESIYGLDIDETMVRISLMNLMMHGIKKPNVKRSNALSDSQPRPSDNTYDVILANPPFKGSLNIAEVSDRFRIRTTKTEILFLELMYHALAPSGRCAVIVPEGVLFGNSNAHRQVRELLLTKCRLDAVISMPSGVFKPYAGVSTAVLFFTKGEPTEKVWFYKMESDGFTLDDKRTLIDGKGDIPEIVDFVRNGDNGENNRKNKHFFVPIEEIKEKDWDLSISKYREIEYEEVKYEHPGKIIENIESLEQEISEGIKELKKKI